MPFIGKDWRAPGETWIRINHTAGWEQIKLRPIQLSTSPDTISCLNIDDKLKRPPSSNSLSSNDENTSSSENSMASGVLRSDSDESVSIFEDEEPYIPHCFVKTTRSKEFIGCTSMSEAFHRLDLARLCSSVRHFNYVCKVTQILVTEKLQNLSATARKHLFAIIQAIVIHSVDQDVHVSTARDLVNQFGAGLEGHVCGSPQLVTRQLDTVSGLLEMINEKQPTTLPDSSEDSMTFLDLPREVISQILRRLPDHVSLLETAKAHETFEALVDREGKLWETLCRFHFTQEQIEKHKTLQVTWRHAFFQLKKYYGLREIYAGMIHICCACRALFWNDLGHPCVSHDAPSVRVTPQQFVDMLLFL